MFSGIIHCLGRIEHVDRKSSKLYVSSKSFTEICSKSGDSIAIDGVCLTVEELDGLLAIFSLGEETKAKTLLAHKISGDIVNIEPAIKVADRLNGHLVQGHVDAIVSVLALEKKLDNLVLFFALPKELALLIVKKGSVAINGVSLTINDVFSDRFNVCIVPYTLRYTNLPNYQVGDLVHLETDILGRYVIGALIHQGIIKDFNHD